MNRGTSRLCAWCQHPSVFRRAVRFCIGHHQNVVSSFVSRCVLCPQLAKSAGRNQWVSRLSFQANSFFKSVFIHIDGVSSSIARNRNRSSWQYIQNGFRASFRSNEKLCTYTVHAVHGVPSSWSKHNAHPMFSVSSLPRTAFCGFGSFVTKYLLSRASDPWSLPPSRFDLGRKPHLYVVVCICHEMTHPLIFSCDM